MPLRDDNALRQCVWSDRLNVRSVNTGVGAHARVSVLATLTAQSPQWKCNLRTKEKKGEVSACTVPTTVSKPQPPPVQENPALSTIVSSTPASYSAAISLNPQ